MNKSCDCNTLDEVCIECCRDSLIGLGKVMYLDKNEIESLVKEFSHSFINVNENPLASEVMERMIKFVEDK